MKQKNQFGINQSSPSISAKPAGARATNNRKMQSICFHLGYDIERKNSNDTEIEIKKL